jgi:hypothetical protein
VKLVDLAKNATFCCKKGIKIRLVLNFLDSHFRVYKIGNYRKGQSYNNNQIIHGLCHTQRHTNKYGSNDEACIPKNEVK